MLPFKAQAEEQAQEIDSLQDTSGRFAEIHCIFKWREFLICRNKEVPKFEGLTQNSRP